MFHNLFTTNSHFVHIYFLYYFHKNKLYMQMINSKIAHRFFIIAPVAIQSGSPHFIRLFRAENSGSIFILYTRYFPPFQYIRPYFFFQPQPKRDGPSASMAGAVPFQSLLSIKAHIPDHRRNPEAWRRCLPSSPSSHCHPYSKLPCPQLNRHNPHRSYRPSHWSVPYLIH